MLMTCNSLETNLQTFGGFSSRLCTFVIVSELGSLLMHDDRAERRAIPEILIKLFLHCIAYLKFILGIHHA